MCASRSRARLGLLAGCLILSVVLLCTATSFGQTPQGQAQDAKKPAPATSPTMTATGPAGASAGKLAPPGVPLKQTEALPDFWKSRIADIDQAVGEVKKGQAEVLTKSAGGRKIYLVSYGPRSNTQSQSFYNSACAAGNPAWYAVKPRGRAPVVLLLGPVHGQEFEGTVALLNLIHLAETGKDYRGKEWPRLLRHFEECRVLIVPLANPDGRARVLLDSFVGQNLRTYNFYGMGTYADGSPQDWPQVKERQPMVGNVGYLGGYFNDSGINLMHDDWFGHMAPENQAILDLTKREAADYALCLHSHGSEPELFSTDYADPACREKAADLSERLFPIFEKLGQKLNHIRREPRAAASRPSRGDRAPSPFNLQSAIHHSCGATVVLYESPAGLRHFDPVSHDDILDLQMILFEELLAYAAESPVVWER